MPSSVSSTIAEYLETEILERWLRSSGSVDVEAEPADQEGMSASTYKVSASLRFFVKYSPDSVSEEIQNYKLLRQTGSRVSEHLLAPLFPDNRHHSFIPYPYQNAETFHALVARADGSAGTDSDYNQWLLRVYKDYLSAHLDLWTSTKAEGSEIGKDLYYQRVRSRAHDLRAALGSERLAKVMFMVNGDKIGTFAELMHRFDSALDNCSWPRASCTVHGDEHPRNFMLLTGSIDVREWDSWLLIDYGSVKTNADWVYAIAKMLHWWQVYFPLEVAKSDVELRNALDGSIEFSATNGELNIEYSRQALTEFRAQYPALNSIVELINTFADEASSEFGESGPEWTRRLQIALFAVLFGSVPLHLSEFRFAGAVMLAESLRHLPRDS